MGFHWRFYFFIFPSLRNEGVIYILGVALLYRRGFRRHVFEKSKRAVTLQWEKLRGDNPILPGLKAFFREGYTQRYYWLFYLTVAFWAMATTGNVFSDLLRQIAWNHS